MASETILKQKKEAVSNLAKEMKEAKLVLLTDYRGITVESDTELRRNLRGINAKYRIIKNNIIRRALTECGIKDLGEKLEGPTAILLCNEDYLEPSKVIYKFTKDNNYYQIKGGVIDGEVKTTEEIITLAKLPSRETLLSMLAGALLGNVSKFAVALEQVRLQKEAGVEPEAKEEAKPEETASDAEEPVKEEAKQEEKPQEKEQEEAKKA